MRSEFIEKLCTKDWNITNCPREKLINCGRKSLTNPELLAIIGSGNSEQNALDLAKTILASTDKSLHKLSNYQKLS